MGNKVIDTLIVIGFGVVFILALFAESLFHVMEQLPNYVPETKPYVSSIIFILGYFVGFPVLGYTIWKDIRDYRRNKNLKPETAPVVQNKIETPPVVQNKIKQQSGVNIESVTQKISSACWDVEQEAEVTSMLEDLNKRLTDEPLPVIINDLKKKYDYSFKYGLPYVQQILALYL